MSDRVEFPVAGLTDGVVTLRPAAEADIAAIVEACRDPAIQRYTTVPSGYRETDAREWLERSERGRAAGTDFPLLVVDAADGSLLGSVGVHDIDAQGRCRVGYWVAAPARGRGVASRALRLLCNWAFEELGMARIELHVEPENEASRRVAERVGFAPEGLLRSFMEVAGARRDMLRYSLLPGRLR